MRVIAMWLAVVLGSGLGAGAAGAQTWIQIEARPGLVEATDRARGFAGRLDNVAGFRMRTGWYAVALGPFTTGQAASELARLRSSGAIPPDSYLADAGTYGRQFWPLGASPGATAAPLVTTQTPDVAVEVTTQPAPAPALPTEETVQQARQSERALDLPAREDIQRALAWTGFYNAGIDGDFGPGTRRAMSDWQAAQGLPVTGVLTTAQRAALVDGFNTDMAALGMETVTDAAAGITVSMPVRKVSFAGTSAPFSKYEGTDGTQVLLISQAGDRNRLRALYEVLQTLDVVPLEGPRNLRRGSFTIEGSDARHKTLAYAAVTGGAIKGFVLVWPADQEGSVTPLAAAMRSSLTTVDGVVLPEGSGAGADQNVDLLAGLAIRRPIRARSGFFVDAAGKVVTTMEAVAQCTRVTLGEDVETEVAMTLPDLGLALLTPLSPQAPVAFATFRQGAGRLGSDIAVAGFSYGGRLGAPTLTFGTLADVTGLEGEETLDRLSLTPQDGDVGGPVLSGDGQVLGVLQPAAAPGGRVLPGDVRFATDASALVAALTQAGLSPTVADPGTAIAAEDLAVLAYDMTVQVNCWN